MPRAGDGELLVGATGDLQGTLGVSARRFNQSAESSVFCAVCEVRSKGMLEANLLGQLDSLVVVTRTLAPVAGGIFDLREAVQYVSACGFIARLGGDLFEREPCASRFVDLVDVPQQERADVTRTVLQRGTVLEQLAIDPAGSVERVAIERATCGPIHERSPDLDMRAAGVV